MSQEYLIQCRSRDNVFQCNLNTDFRDIRCGNSNLSLKYVESTLNSPQLGTMMALFETLNFVDILSLKYTPSIPFKIFQELTKLYKKTINGSNECLFFDTSEIITPIRMPDGTLHQQTLIKTRLMLLPTEIFIAPVYLVQSFLIAPEDEQRLTYWNEESLL